MLKIQSLVFALFLCCAALLQAGDVRMVPVGPEGIRDLSNWAGMLEGPDGAIYVSSGDHGKVDGNAWLSRFDPATGAMQIILDVRRDAGDHYVEGGPGHGKIHVAPVLANDGRIYVSTCIAPMDSNSLAAYQGSLLFSFDPQTPEAITCHGVIFPGQSTFTAQYLPSINAYAAWVLPAGKLMVYCLNEGRIIHESEEELGDDGEHARLLARDRQERLYYHDAANRVYRWDPATGQTQEVPLVIPSASSLPAERSAKYRFPQRDFIRVMESVSDHEMVGVTHYGLFFVYDTVTGRTTLLDHALGVYPIPGGYYLTDLAVSEDGETIYYGGGLSRAAGTHEHDNPIIAWRWREGTMSELGRMNLLTREGGFARMRYNFGTLLSRDGQRLYLSPNTARGTHVVLLEMVLDDPSEPAP